MAVWRERRRPDLVFAETVDRGPFPRLVLGGSNCASILSLNGTSMEAPPNAWGGFRGVSRAHGSENDAPGPSVSTVNPWIVNQCAHCLKRCKDAETLRKHQTQARHSPCDPRCGACGKHFANLDTLRQHVDGQLPSAKCKAAYEARGCARCLTIEPEGRAHRCPFESSFQNPRRGHARRAVALDCEMVGTEEDGSGAMCARVCVVDIDGSVLLSTYVAPDRPITDHRTELTGITPGSLEGAPSLREVRTAVLAVLNGSKSKDDDKALLVGHDLPHDLECLGIKWPRRLCRDTAHHPPLQRHTHAPYKLRTLTLDHLGDAIQREGETHDPREDAWAAMRLYIGAAGLCAAHRGGESAVNVAFNGGDEVLVCGDASAGLNANGGTGRASTMPAPRFRCWCGDFTIGEVGTGAAAAAAAAPSPLRAKPASPSPMKSPLRDSTYAYASPTLTR